MYSIMNLLYLITIVVLPVTTQAKTVSLDVIVSEIDTRVTYDRDLALNAALVISLHGWGMRRDTYQEFVPLNRLVTHLGFVLLEPKAPYLGSWDWSKPEEVLPFLVDYAEQEFRIDRSRIYLVGHSAGAQAIFDVASSGVIPVKGMLTLSGNGEEPLIPTKLVHVHGFRDINISYRSGVQTVERYSLTNGCRLDPMATEVDLDGLSAIRMVFLDCTAADVLFYRVSAGHFPEYSESVLNHLLRELMQPNA